jgi:hypothetical protein
MLFIVYLPNEQFIIKQLKELALPTFVDYGNDIRTGDDAYIVLKDYVSKPRTAFVDYDDEAKWMTWFSVNHFMEHLQKREHTMFLTLRNIVNVQQFPIGKSTVDMIYDDVECQLRVSNNKCKKNNKYKYKVSLSKSDDGKVPFHVDDFDMFILCVGAENLQLVTPSYPTHYHYEFPMKTTDDGKVLRLSDPRLKQLIHPQGDHSNAFATTGQQGDDTHIKGVTGM